MIPRHVTALVRLDSGVRVLCVADVLASSSLATALDGHAVTEYGAWRRVPLESLTLSDGERIEVALAANCAQQIAQWLALDTDARAIAHATGLSASECRDLAQAVA